MKSETANWVKLSNEDYKSADILLENRRYPHAIYYYCQAIEKYLKAYQIEYQGEYPKKIHNLRSLIKLSGIPHNNTHLLRAETLDKHYNQVRYTDLSQAHYNTKKKIEPIIKQLTDFYQWVHQEFNNH